MKKQDMKQIKPLKFRFIVVWIRSDIISKVRFVNPLIAASFCDSLRVPAHVYNIKTFALVAVNKYCREYNNVT